MRRYSFLVLSLCFLSFTAFSQTLTRMQSWGLDFESIHWINDQKGFIAGEKLIAYTEDGGTTWKEVLQKFETRFLDISFANVNQGIAVGSKGTIFVSSDGGLTWQNSNSNTNLDIYAIEILPSGKVIIAGQNGLVMNSEKIGDNWIISTPIPGVSAVLDIKFVNENLGFAVGTQGKIFRTGNGGLNWTELSSGSTEDLSGIAISPTNKIYVAGKKGTLLSSSTNGDSWNKLSSPVALNLNKIRINPLDEKILLVSGEGNTILRSTNSGTSFSKITLPNTNERRIADLAFKPGSQILYFSGEDGYSMVSTNGGANWTLRLFGNRVDFLTMDFVTPQFGFVGGTKGKIFSSSNSMQTLVARPIPTETDILSLEFWNSNYGFVTGKKGMILRTSNSGQAWTTLDPGTEKDILGIHLFLPEFPYVTGKNGLIARSSGTSGNSWEVFSPAVTKTEKNINDMNAFDLNNAFAVGDQGYISTSNNGFQWNIASSGTNEDLLFSARINESTAMAVGKNGTILKSTDLAKTWRKINSGVMEDLHGIHFFGNNFGFIVGKNGLFLVSSDGGETWRKFNSGTIRNLFAIYSVNENTAYVAGEEGTILAYNCIPPTGTLSGISGETATCLGKSIYTITDLPQAGSELFWRVDGGEIISGQGTNTVEINWTNPGRNGVFVSRLSFCGAGQTSAREVQVSSPPSQNLVPDGQGAVCQSNSYSYTLPLQQGMKYTWSVSGGEIQEGQGTRQIRVKWTGTGSQVLSVILENFCGKTEAITLPIQVEKAPEQPSSIVGENLSGLGEQIYSITQIPNLDYRWLLPDGGKIISGQGTPRVTVLWEKEGVFELSVQAQNACNFGPKSGIQVTVNRITAIEPNPGIEKLKIFPNPNFGSLTVESPVLDQWTVIEILNSMGQRILRRSIEKGDQIHYFENLPKGLNVITFTGPSGQVQKKILSW
jgi:photosystem II stability/assembly factor-like uncharacterized protein